MDERPTLAEQMYDLAEAHRVRAIAADSEFDKGACDAFERAAKIIEQADQPDNEELLEHVEELGTASAGHELEDVK
jgi:hypothetical protein